jgi:hypothetical protein
MHETTSAPRDATEAKLRAEIEELKQRLAGHPSHGHHRRPASGTLFMLALVIVVVVAAAFFTGYLPRLKRETELVAAAKSDTAAIPLVNVTAVERSSTKSELVLCPRPRQRLHQTPLRRYRRPR